MLTLYKSSWTLTFPFRETGATPEPRYQIRIILSHAPFFGYINMVSIRLLIKIKMTFDNYNIVFDEFADICDFGDLRESPDQSNDRFIFNVPKQEMLSPPISMPSSKLHDLDTIDTENDSDLRENNFLRRMNQSKSIHEPKTENITEIDSLIVYKPVPVQAEDSFKSNFQFSCSKVKLKLEKQPKFDQNFMRRATNRRSIKNQKREYRDSRDSSDSRDNYNWGATKSNSEIKLESTETCEVW